MTAVTAFFLMDCFTLFAMTNTLLSLRGSIATVAICNNDQSLGIVRAKTEGLLHFVRNDNGACLPIKKRPVGRFYLSVLMDIPPADQERS